jgi:hypothetical protein
MEGFLWGAVLLAAFILSFFVRFNASITCYAIFKFGVGLLGSLSAVTSGLLWLVSSHLGLKAATGTPVSNLSLWLNDWAAAGAFLSAICFMALWNVDNFAEYRSRTQEAKSPNED